jgi:hypothetical protein
MTRLAVLRLILCVVGLGREIEGGWTIFFFADQPNACPMAENS